VRAGSGGLWLTKRGKGWEVSCRGKRSTFFLGKTHQNLDVKHLTKAHILLAFARSAPMARTWSGTSVRSISLEDKRRDKRRLPNSLAITKVSLSQSENHESTLKSPQNIPLCTAMTHGYNGTFGSGILMGLDSWALIGPLGA